MVIPPLIGNPYNNGHRNPYYKLDDHLLPSDNNGFCLPLPFPFFSILYLPYFSVPRVLEGSRDSLGFKNGPSSVTSCERQNVAWKSYHQVDFSSFRNREKWEKNTLSHSWIYQLSNEKRAPGWLGYIGDKKLPRYIGIIINHEIRIPINQPV